MAFSPLIEGHLARQPGTVTASSKAAERKILKKKIRDWDLENIKRVEELAEKHSWATSQVALAWSLAKGSSPVVGVNSVGRAFLRSWLPCLRCSNKPERLREAIVKGKRLTAEEISYLESP
jgi:diketogulonate reductase-like aldo/keto reductase